MNGREGEYEQGGGEGREREGNWVREERGIELDVVDKVRTGLKNEQ